MRPVPAPLSAPDCPRVAGPKAGGVPPRWCAGGPRPVWRGEASRTSTCFGYWASRVAIHGTVTPPPPIWGVSVWC